MWYTLIPHIIQEMIFYIKITMENHKMSLVVSMSLMRKAIEYIQTQKQMVDIILIG